MREILFRGKRLDNGEWVYGAYSEYDVTCDRYDGDAEYETVSAPSIIAYDEECLWYRVDPATVGQYTGLKDRNGTRIFEGDVVRHHNDNPFSNVEEKGVVFFDEKAFGWRRTSNGGFHRGVVDTYRISSQCVYEVIGNIHDAEV